MKKIVKNPTFEFIINENDTITVFDEDMTVIHNLDDIGKIILGLLEKPTDEELLKEEISKVFVNVNFSEFNDFMTELKDKRIVIEV